MNRIDAVTRISAIGLVINLTISVIATRQIGITGVVWGTLIGNAVACVLYLHLYLRSLQLSGRRFVTQILLPVYPFALLCAGLLAIFVRFFPPVGLPAVLLYAGVTLSLYSLLFLTIGMDRVERQQIAAMIRRRQPA